MPECLAPWTVRYLSIGRDTMCSCASSEEGFEWNSERMKRTRKAMHEGNRVELPDFCISCLDSPTSMGRYFYSERFHPAAYEKSLKMYNPDTGEMSGMHLGHLLLNFSNLCNQACRMCTWANSHRIAKRDGMEKTVWHSELPYKDVLRDQLPTLGEISFHGGEPLLNEDLPEVFEMLLPYEKDLIILFMTNGKKTRLRDGSSLHDWMNRFSNVNMPYSMDGTHEVNEYIRVGCNTDRLLENIKEMKRECGHVNISIRFTASNLNIHNVVDWILLVEPLDVHLTIDTVLLPNHYHPSNLPEDVLRLIFGDLYKRMEEVRPCHRELVRSAMGYLAAGWHTPDLWEKFCRETKRVDQYEGQDILSIRPELAPHFNIIGVG